MTSGHLLYVVACCITVKHFSTELVWTAQYLPCLLHVVHGISHVVTCTLLVSEIKFQRQRQSDFSVIEYVRLFVR